jgi:hypothetical protein
MGPLSEGAHLRGLAATVDGRQLRAAEGLPDDRVAGCVADRSWGEAGLDCGDGLVARFRWTHGEWRIVVSGPLGAV